MKNKTNNEKAITGFINATDKQLESVGISDIPKGTLVEIYDIDKYESVYGLASKIRYKYYKFDFIIPTSWVAAENTPLYEEMLKTAKEWYENLDHENRADILVRYRSVNDSNIVEMYNREEPFTRPYPSSVREIPRETADAYQDFLNFMAQEHNLTLTISEMDEIVRHAQELVKKVDEGVISEELSEVESAKGERLFFIPIGDKRWFTQEEYDKLKELTAKMPKCKCGKESKVGICDDCFKKEFLVEPTEPFYCWDEEALGKESRCKTPCDICQKPTK